MTRPPATCELCGGTGLYSPSALPCPKGCKDIVERLVKIAEASRREDGSLIPLGQEIADAVEYITNMLAYISDLEQREKDARVKAQAMHRRAQIAEGAVQGVFNVVDLWLPHLKNPVFSKHDIIIRALKDDFERAVKKARALKDEVR